MTNYKIITYGLAILAGCLGGLKVQGQEAPVADTLIKIEKEKYVPGVLFDIPAKAATSSVSVVSGEMLYKTPTANLTNTFYGLFPGMSVVQGQGEPGYDGASIYIRGIGAYNYGSYAVYVDGFQSNMTYAQYLTPAEIESVSILKDAVALAPFGMKGANGVIWIVTRRGKTGKPQVSLQARTGIQQLQNITKPLSSHEYASLYNEANSNDNGRVWTPVYTQSQLDAYKNGSSINTDWYEETLKQNTPFSSIDASFTGGNKNARYFVLMDYTRSNSFYDVQNDDNHSNARMTQYNIRSNFDFTIFDYIDGKMDFGGRIEDRKYPAYTGTSLWGNLERYPDNIYPVKNDNGTWTGTTVYPNNPVASIRELGIYTTHDRSMQMNFTLKERLDFLLKGFYLSQAVSFSSWTRGSRNITKDYARYIGSEVQTSNQNTNYTISDDYGTNQWNWQQWLFSAGYDRQIGLHKLTSGLNYLQYLRKVDANQNGAAGVNTQYGYANFSGRVNYAYDSKYLAEVSFSYSGSDNYKPGNRYVFYPAFSAGWVLTNEQFMSGAGAVDFLKLRASAGQVGYDYFSGGRYLYEQYYKSSGSYPTGNATPTWRGAIVPAYIANPDITAEKSTKYNIGIDAGLLKGLSVTVDVFMDKRSGIVSADNYIMDAAGMDAPYRNIGKVTTKGLEFSVSYKNRAGDLSYEIGTMGTYIKDNIDYMAELATASPYAMQTGKAIGTPIGYEALGFYDISDFDAAGNLVNNPVPAMGMVQPGDIKYRNLNGDNIIDERDKTAIGKSSFPDFVYSFTTQLGYKGLDLRVLMQGVLGRDVNLLSGAYNKVIAFENNGNIYAWARNRWAYYPGQGIDTRSTATYPRLSTEYVTNNYTTSSFWVKNGNFLKLRNVELGYTLPERRLSKLGLQSARVYVNGVNLLTFSSLLSDYDIDPETMSGYPGVKSYNVGLTVGL